MSGYRISGFIGLSLAVASGTTACTDGADSADAKTVTATVVTLGEHGEQQITSETFTSSEFAAMVDARRQAQAAAGQRTGVRPDIMKTSCQNGAALWMWNEPFGWGINAPTPAQMLCVIGAGTFTLPSVGWEDAVQSIWPGSEAGGIWPGNVGECNLECTTPSSIAGFSAWGPQENTPGCTSGRFVLLSDSPISCWLP